MFIKMRLSAHEALWQYMLNDHAPLDRDTTKLIYDIIAKAETDEAFATNLDFACAGMFNGQTADGLDDLVCLVSDMPDELDEFLKQYFL